MKTKDIIAWILAGLLALAFLASGVTKVIGMEMQLKNFASWGYPLWFRFPIGLSEIAFGIALILLPRFRHLTIYVIFIWTLVAVATHIRVAQYAMISGPLILGFVALVILLLTRREARLD